MTIDLTSRSTIARGDEAEAIADCRCIFHQLLRWQHNVFVSAEIFHAGCVVLAVWVLLLFAHSFTYLAQVLSYL